MPLARISQLPHALRDGRQFAQRLAGRRPAVFLDYDGTLTPIVDRPEDAVISEGMCNAVRRLAERTKVCVVSGRDRPAVTQWMNIDGLVVAGSHGFDIGNGATGAVRYEAVVGFEDLLSTVTQRLRCEVEPVQGAIVEPKRFSVAVHYRLVPAGQHTVVKAVVDAVLADYPELLKITPGKMVYEIQPQVDWDKGRAVQYLRHALRVDGEEFAPLYLGDDLTDEDAFAALHGPLNGWGIGVVVADVDDPGEADRMTAADFMLNATGEVEQFLNTLAC